MKNVKLLLVLVVALGCASLAALDFSLSIDQVHPYSVSGTLLITNSSEQDVTLHFPSAGTFDLMVDGNAPAVVYPGILMDLTIPGGTTLSQGVGYVGLDPLTPGTHVARARYVLPDNPPAGNPQTFYYSSTPSDIYDLDYRFTITDVGIDTLTGTLQMYNPTDQVWSMNFYTLSVARIYVDGSPGIPYVPPMWNTLFIQPGETFSQQIHHNATNPFAPGTHIAEARLYQENDPLVGLPQSFYVTPTENHDELSPALEPYSLIIGPNPCINMLNISTNSKEHQTYTIYDIKGRVVLRASSRGEYVWNGRDMAQKLCPAGIYFIKAGMGNKSTVQRFVKL